MLLALDVFEKLGRVLYKDEILTCFLRLAIKFFILSAVINMSMFFIQKMNPSALFCEIVKEFNKAMDLGPKQL